MNDVKWIYKLELNSIYVKVQCFNCNICVCVVANWQRRDGSMWVEKKWKDVKWLVERETEREK